MGGHNSWLDGITDRINQLKDTLSEKEYKKYQLRLLLCVAQRVAEFSPECGQCQIFQQDISTLAQDVGNLAQVDDKDKRKTHSRKIRDIVNHLTKQHKLVTEGYYMGIGIAIGAGIGVALGSGLDNVGIGIPIGTGIGIAIGTALDARAKKEGRIICPSEKTVAPATHNTKLFLVIGIAVLALAGLVAFILYRSLM